MPMVRGSSMMSLGTWNRRSIKHQRFLNLSNVFLLIVSTGLLFSSTVLMSFYHMTKVRTCREWEVNPNPSLVSYISGAGISTPPRCACWPSASTHSPCPCTASSYPPRSPGLLRSDRGLLIIIFLFRGLISLIAVFLSVAFLGQLFSVFSAIELRNTIGHNIVPELELDNVSTLQFRQQSPRVVKLKYNSDTSDPDTL